MRVMHAAMLAGIMCATQSEAQVTGRGAQYWLPAPYNFAFYDTFPEAAKSFYPAHFAHFRVYENLLNDQSMSDLRQRILDYIDHPPTFEPPFEVVAPTWSRMAYRTGAAMEWTHHLHEQLYDIFTDDRVVDKKAAGDRAINFYLAEGRAAFSTRGYGHAFMLGGGPWAGRFAESQPEINGILWAYHWHHAAMYEALMEPNVQDRRAGVKRVLEVFRDSVLPNPPTYMPLTAEIAPRFGAMFPAAAHIFDNLHMMHDVVNDILSYAPMNRQEQGEEIERLLSQMLFVDQASVVPPTIPAGAHTMDGSTARIPTELPDGSWLPQGHPQAQSRPMGHTGHHPQPGESR